MSEQEVPTQTPRFVVSTGRCGSTGVSMLLATHPDVLSLSELLSSLQPRTFPVGLITARQFWGILSEPDPVLTAALRGGADSPELLYPFDTSSRFSRKTGLPPIAAVTLPALTDDPDGLYDELEQAVLGFPAADAGKLYRLLFDWLTVRFGRRAWIERSGASLRYVEHTIRHFPGAKFVHLHRDGPACALSMSRHPTYRIYVAEQMRREGTLPESFDVSAVDSIPLPLERFARHWSAMILHGMRKLDPLPRTQVLHLSYEDLVADPSTHLAALVEFLALPDPPAGWLESASGWVRRPAPSSDDLSNEDRERLERACEPGRSRMRRLTPA